MLAVSLCFELVRGECLVQSGVEGSSQCVLEPGKLDVGDGFNEQISGISRHALSSLVYQTLQLGQRVVNMHARVPTKVRHTIPLERFVVCTALAPAPGVAFEPISAGKT